MLYKMPVGLGDRTVGSGCTTSARSPIVYDFFIPVTLVAGFPEIAYQQCARKNREIAHGPMFLL